MKGKVYLSVISNVRNEEKNLCELHKRLVAVCKKLKKPYEVIYVENGSTDKSLETLKTLKGAKIISLRIPVPASKTTQTAALDAGIKHAKGEVTVTIDSDLQNPPEEIPKLLKKLESGYDIVSGWRKKRKDNIAIKALSKIGGWMRAKFINPGVHDLGCTLKAYRKECFENLDLYGEMHRYITAILKWRGFKVTEVVTKHSPRKYGKSSYNWTKAFRGFVDMLLIWFWKKYSDRPLHLFGIFGTFLSLSGGGLLIVLAVLRILQLISLSRSIWPLVAILFIIVGIQFFIFGIIMDMLIRNYYAAGKEKSYLIKEIIEV